VTDEKGAMMGDRKGRVRITIDVEINEGLMDAVKEGMTKMHWSMPGMSGKRKEEM
jgi:hypothetical protein